MNNQFNFIGRISKDLELKATSTGKSVLDLPIAVNNGKDAKGVQDTTFITISVFGSSAEVTSKYCHKGDLIAVSGIIKNHNWEDKNGVKHYDYSFLSNKITFLQTKKKDEVEEAKNEDSPYIDFANEIFLEDDDLAF